jgi:uncharacterized protein YbdZ (MbtH family)
LINSTHLEVHGNLPDSFAQSTACQTYVNANYPVMTPESYAALETQQYHDAKFNFEMRLNAIQSAAHAYDYQSKHKLIHMVQCGYAFLDDLEKQKIASDTAKNDSFDIKHMTSILNDCNDYTQDAKNTFIPTKLREAADKLAGTSKYMEKLHGLLYAFVGAVVMAASALVIFVTYGAVAPVAQSGLIFGATAVLKGLAIAGAGAGLGLTAAGLSIFSSGKRQGASKSLLGFTSSVEATPKLSMPQPIQDFGTPPPGFNPNIIPPTATTAHDVRRLA